jgi:hypothetical protein
MGASFLIPDDFRAFMQQVVAYLDAPTSEKFLDAEDALPHESGYGGRIDHIDTFQFTYFTRDGQHRWLIVMRESVLRDIALGIVIEVPGECAAIEHEPAARAAAAASGHPLLVWGEYGDDALHVKVQAELLTALDGLHASAAADPRMLRMWSAGDDQVIAVVHRDQCALYVVASPDGYATSCGDPNRKDSLELLDHDGHVLAVPASDLIPWAHALNGLLRFAERGDLGPEIKVEGRIPSVLLMLGDIDRKSALAARHAPPKRLDRSSLPRLLTPPVPMPVVDDTSPQTLVEIPEASASEPMAMKVEELSAWARRLIDVLYTRELIELGTSNLDEISYQLGGLLQAHATEAEHSLDTAEWLANEIGAVRGVDKIYATAGDLQIALRRSRN